PGCLAPETKARSDPAHSSPPPWNVVCERNTSLCLKITPETIRFISTHLACKKISNSCVLPDRSHCCRKPFIARQSTDNAGEASRDVGVAPKGSPQTAFFNQSLALVVVPLKECCRHEALFSLPRGVRCRGHGFPPSPCLHAFPPRGRPSYELHLQLQKFSCQHRSTLQVHGLIVTSYTALTSPPPKLQL
ncbi:unnamed protein product, partial [Ectocarpus sp. 12 AP-2014]